MALDFIYTSINNFEFVGKTNGYDGGKYVAGALQYPEEIRFNGINSIHLYPRIFSYTIWNNHKILSSIKPTGTDTSGRPGNFLAQHLVLEEPQDIIEAGPAWLLVHRRNWLDRWDHKEKKTYEKSVIDPEDYVKREYPPTWEKYVPEWEDKLKELVDSIKSGQKWVILFAPKRQNQSKIILDLFFEALSRVSKTDRWKVAFSTYATELHKSLGWQWMGIAQDDNKSKEKLITSATQTIVLQ